MPHDRLYGSGQHSAQPYNADSRMEYGSISRSYYNAHDLSGNKSESGAPNPALDLAPSTSLSSRYGNAKPSDESRDAPGIFHASSSSAPPRIQDISQLPSLLRSPAHARGTT
ncbi:hypothetical protein BS47DRAFT_228095 [Hydnum rufescens UP504]|uniref:Uncharacterized protein n=1 Tax=Hydnum rufescens UP504 TaxID=1448309 RepID=A0A9P6DYP8_9AGAM|nr:hypothetical protein BS47DRAFT_228095 [Hydnum rufescens UP504]